MNWRLKFAVFITVILLIFPAISSIASHGLKVGDTITDFALTDALTMNTLSFEKDIKGKGAAFAFLFMTTACSACKAELALLSEMTGDFKDKLKVYAISVDLDGINTVPKYNDTYKFNATYLLDPEFTIAPRFGFIFTPGLVIASESGKILYLKGGYTPAEKYDVIEAIKDALR